MGALSFGFVFLLPHVKAEAISILPVLEDRKVRVRLRVKYVSSPRLLLEPKLFRRDYRYQNLSWFDGLSVLTVDGNGDVFSITLQRQSRRAAAAHRSPSASYSCCRTWKRSGRDALMQHLGALSFGFVLLLPHAEAE